MVRAKFKCTSKEGNTVRLDVVLSGSKENDEFFKYTPGGSIYMAIDNDVAKEKFEVEKEYYVDFTLAE